MYDRSYQQQQHTALVAMDARYAPAIAERAAIRYDAAKLEEVSQDALKARSGEEVRTLYRTACQVMDERLADRCLGEEKVADADSLHGAGPARQVR